METLQLGKKHTILISSHILAEISQMCNKVIIINKGKIIRTDNMENIEEEAKPDETEITLTVEENNTKLPEIKNEIKAITSIELIEEKENEKVYSLKHTGSEDIRKELFKKCVDKDITIIEMKKKEISLEDAFLKITKEEEKK